MKQPLFSIITVTYNCKDLLAPTLESIAKQSYQNFEYLAIDGGSTDGTLELLQSHPVVTELVSEPDEGIYDAINKGLVRAKGTLVGIIHAGDYYLDDVFSKIAARYEESPFSMIVGPHYWNHLDYQRLTVGKPKQLELGLPLCHQAIFYERRLHEPLGLYDLKYPLAADHAFILQVYQNHGIETTSDAICSYLMGGRSDRSFLDYAEQVRQIGHEQGQSPFMAEYAFRNKQVRYYLRNALSHLPLGKVLQKTHTVMDWIRRCL